MNFKILDTTLRDGSYAIDFSFTESDTQLICKELEESGIKLIEIGHGVGLSAYKHSKTYAAVSDEEYMKAAASVLKKSLYGMFCIPGIANLEDIDLAASNNMGFIRIGTAGSRNSDYCFIEKAKNYRMFTAVNFMKSYAIPIEKFKDYVKAADNSGADLIYIVDSAGGMFPEDIKKYFDAIREVSDTPVGFHGHNNLGLAVSNSLYASEIGIEYLDVSLQGLGRSAGNASTELLVSALVKKGLLEGIDLMSLMKTSEKFISPLLTGRKHDSLDVISGFADFHSSYMPHILKFSAKYNVNPITLILEWTKISKLDIDDVRLEELASSMDQHEDFYFAKYKLKKYAGLEQG